MNQTVIYRLDQPSFLTGRPGPKLLDWPFRMRPKIEAAH
jgi:hypothetical protein